MTNKYNRIPRNYNGTALTTQNLNQILPKVLSSLSDVYQEKGELILATWPEVIGPKLAPMTKAVSFSNGVLTVKVKNSTLYSLLNQYDKPKILKDLQQKFPKSKIQNIMFRMDNI